MQFRKRLSNLKNISYLFLVLDLIVPLHEPSLKLQMDYIMPHEVCTLVSAYVGKLQSTFVSLASFKESSLKYFKASVLKNVPKAGIWRPVAGVSFPLKKCSLNALRTEFCGLAQVIVTALQERFSSSELLSNVNFVPKTYL